MPGATILIIDPDRQTRASLRSTLEQADYAVLAVSDTSEAEQALERGVDLVVLDFGVLDGSGEELLPELRRAHPETAVIMTTSRPTVEKAVEAMQLGAYHVAAKPIKPAPMLLAVARALEGSHLRRELRRLSAGGARRTPVGLHRFLGESQPVQEVRTLLGKIATSPASTVLLVGESGTGKSLAARLIHDNSARAGRPFVTITCSAVPGTLMESELFGHERGAFTDAKQQKRGLMEQAHGGTVFLDEFTEMEPMLQAKLLGFLEDKTFRRVGGNRDIQVDVRLIGATNRNLEDAVREGALRKDLYYRLQVLTVRLPALRERTDDVAVLAQSFIDLYNREFGKDIQGLSGKALRRLESHPWEGNVRELRNAIERAMLFAEGDLLGEDDFVGLGPAAEVTEAMRLPAAGIKLVELERSLVVQALQRARGNRTRAAALLGLSRDQIRYRIEKFGLE